MILKNYNFAMAIELNKGIFDFSGEKKKRFWSGIKKKIHCVSPWESIWGHKQEIPSFYKIIVNGTCVTTLNVLSCKVSDSCLG